VLGDVRRKHIRSLMPAPWLWNTLFTGIGIGYQL